MVYASELTSREVTACHMLQVIYACISHNADITQLHCELTILNQLQRELLLYRITHAVVYCHFPAMRHVPHSVHTKQRPTSW